MAEPTTKQLLEKLTGKRIFLSTRCGTFREQGGVIQQVFENFFLFHTVEERSQDETPIRNWVWVDNIGVITEAPRLAVEQLAIER
ncbi:MAG: hypothetical protein D6761_09880 [Candidatus Dadabacteria bacterium]|nr:MAG: hypothetical protein D6761_09880 [Candidatus Dadabacteria bacterium]